MERLSEIRQRLLTLGELGGVFAAMKALAAVRVQQARAGLPGIRRYTDIVDRALGEALVGVGEAPAVAGNGPGAVVVFCSEHGFTGAFDRRLLERADAACSHGERLMVVGARGAALAVERGQTVAWHTSMPSHGDGLVDAARAVAIEVARCVDAGEAVRVDLVFAASSIGASYEPTIVRLFPFDRSHLAAAASERDVPPVLYLPRATLVDRLIDEWVLAVLLRAATESFASENAARLATMDAADRNIRDKLDALRIDERQQRQDEITTELLDLVNGATAAGRANP